MLSLLQKAPSLGGRKTVSAMFPLLASAVSTSASSTAQPAKSKKMPITVLSGFLGAGKTTFLQHALDNKEGLRFGLVVNDMATVNIDAKQIKKQTFGKDDAVDTMELANGCVCCTLAEDLIASVSKLVSLSDLKGIRYDHIIVECSGIAEPRRIRELFQQAEDYNMVLLDKIQLDTLVTVVDGSVFLKLFGSDDDIFSYTNLAVDENDKEGLDSLEREGSGQRKITELLLEQVECADIVLVNKCDLLNSEEEVELVKKVIRSINPTAVVQECTKGKIASPLSIMGSANALGAADWGILDEHRKLIRSVEDLEKKEVEVDCKETACTDSTHSHSHAHSHSDVAHTDSDSVAECKETACTDPTHSHSHSAVSHSHSNDSDSTAECMDEACNDPTHNHDHGHGHGGEKDELTTAEERFGITSFVYRRRRPFHPLRFTSFLQGLGKLSVDGIDNLMLVSRELQDGSPEEENVAFNAARRALMRSKGFVWMATSGVAAYFMSHAGQYLELLVLGRWWADIDKAEWPPGLQEEISMDFDQDGGSHGDRRQELVFIGQFGRHGSTNSRKALEDVLDLCLLDDEEMAAYEKTAKQGDIALRELFVRDKV